MRKILLSLSVLAASYTVHAQTTATFESLTLSKTQDTSYINYSASGKDVGFSDGLAYFPCVYDTSYGGYWDHGFSYSNWTDSVKSGFKNQYSAKSAKGFAGSNKYLVSYGNYNIVRLTGAAKGKSMLGFYVTNNTYAYNSMRDGDAFAKKFKATTKDYFRLDVFGYRSGALTPDSVSFYLADFRNTDTTKNYIVNDWQWVDLAKLGKVDSLTFRLQSTDNGTFGMNTPAYFCMDNFMTNETGLSITNAQPKSDIKIYPNPATDLLFVESSVVCQQQIVVTDIMGKQFAQFEMKNDKVVIDISNYPAGVYLISFSSNGQKVATRFVKQ